MTMDDVFDDFIPLTITGTTSRSRKNDVSFSEISSVSRLSRSYAKRQKKTACQSQSTNADNHCANYAVENMVTIVDRKQHKDSHCCSSANGIQFCPVCQAPFDIIKIDPHIHVNQCSVIFSELKECPKGELCFDYDVYHYRDYAHTVLARIRSSKGHLQHGTLQCVTPKTQKITSCERQYFTSSSSPLNSNSELKRTSSDDVKRHVSGHQNKIISDEHIHIVRTNGSVFGVLHNGDKGTMMPEVHKCDLHESDAGNRHTGTGNCASEYRSLKTCTSDKRNEDISLTRISAIYNRKQGTVPNGKISKDLNLSDTNLKSAEFEGSKSNILTACKKNEGKFGENTHGGGRSSGCNRELKLRAIVECKTDSLSKRCDKDRNIRTHVLPCEVESDSECLNEVRATLSLVLSPSKENSFDGEGKIKAPVKVDASCSEVGWETVGIAALPDSEVGDVTLSLCKCSKTMEINCSLSHTHTVTNSLNNGHAKTKELESKFFSNVRELGLLHELRAKGAAKIPQHQMSLTSYFQSSRRSSSCSWNILTKDVKNMSSCYAVPQDPHCWKSYNLNTTSKEHCERSSDAPKQSKESVAAYWKQRLDGMRRRGLSTMSVMSDDTLTVVSDGEISPSNSYSSQKFVGKKMCPSYKRIPDTSFVVDAFQYGIIPGISHYFLSHFHSDHYRGLSRSFSKPIYCSKITAALVRMKLLVDEKYLHVLDLDVPQKINGVLVTALDANHCPGSIMFLFQLQDGRNHLHVGDFRADPKMESYACFWNLTIHKLFLDTTYCEPRYTFPLQSETVQRVVELAVEHNNRTPSTLFVCGTYTLGKEKVFLGIVEALNCKLWASYEKRKVLECLDNRIIKERLTNRQWDAQVHVCRMFDLNMSFLQRYLKQHEGVFTHIVAFIPTGWEMSRKKRTFDDVNTKSCGNVTIYGVPYSEHSGFTELRRFVQFLKPVDIIPTVNAADRTKQNTMAKYFKQWLSESSVTPLKRKTEGAHYVQQKIARYMNPQTVR